MLTDSEKYILDETCYRTLLVFYKIQLDSNNLKIISYCSNTITYNVIIKNMNIVINNFLNNATTNTITETIKLWENSLEEKLKIVIDKSVLELQQLSLLSINDAIIKKIIVTHKLQFLLKLGVDSIVANNQLYLKNIQLSTSIQTISLLKKIQKKLNEIYLNLDPIQIIEAILNDKDIIQEVVLDILFQLSDEKNIKYPLSVDYLY